MAEAAISFAVGKLGDLVVDKVIEKVDFLQGVEEQVKWLKDELETMQCFLKDAAEDGKNFETTHKWIKDIRQVAFDAEDVIEAFILKVDKPRRSRGLLGKCACLPNHLRNLYRVREEIESIRNRLKQIDERLVRYKSENACEGKPSSSRSNNIAQRRRLSPWQKDKHLVGLDEKVDLILREAILEEKKKGLSIASIVGMGGIGKSTLARVLYNHSEVAGQFDRRAWVVISEQFNHTDTIKELVLQLLNPDEDKLKVLELIEKSPAGHLNSIIYERLKGKRYFIVVDDVWHHEDWDSLATSFPDEQDKASRLIVTSRNSHVPRSAQYVHAMKTLDDHRSWELLLKAAFNDNNDIRKCPRELEDIGREIMRKCDGLPLALIVVGGLLLEQRGSKSGWEKVLKGIDFHLRRRETSPVQAILELSYQDLPSHLKSCFLCLGFFEEDAIIHADRLVRIWIAEGLVQQKEGGLTMEEIAGGYLDELINRNMVQVKNFSNKDDRVKNCQIHDLLHELSIRKAKEEINFEILKDHEDVSQSFDHKPRHRIIHCSTTERLSNKHIRSLFLRRWNCTRSQDWKSYRLLRVLEMIWRDSRTLGSAVGALIGLRYLALTCEIVDITPTMSPPRERSPPRSTPTILMSPSQMSPPRGQMSPHRERSPPRSTPTILMSPSQMSPPQERSPPRSTPTVSPLSSTPVSPSTVSSPLVNYYPASASYNPIYWKLERREGFCKFELPKGFGRLKNLEVLDMENAVVEVPNVLWKMDSLRHIYSRLIYSEVPLRLDTLKNLQTLMYISATSWMLGQSEKMTSLRKLGIELDKNTDATELCSSLAMLENLLCLNLRRQRSECIPVLDDRLVRLHCLRRLKLEGPLTELPSACNFPPNLSYLTLKWSKLKEDPMRVLEKLPKLVYLKLCGAYNGEEMVISSHGFPTLEVLHLVQLWQLSNIKVAEAGMPKLKRWLIINCPRLNQTAEELKTHMNDLQELTIEGFGMHHFFS
ncbi:Apoptotic ATPase [Handroanthus impetiginosus]|uniref:Apoptotic ATPase n=1 Tax=Handroanthus impetiginosus TaxID=429701 RepID=A0A2G9HR09_9LAMI|nr:Apoptotic ATPase [Handroanthus impetiginosus]